VHSAFSFSQRSIIVTLTVKNAIAFQFNSSIFGLVAPKCGFLTSLPLNQKKTQALSLTSARIFEEK
jgi:hypothetical protein